MANWGSRKRIETAMVVDVAGACILTEVGPELVDKMYREKYR